MPRAFRIRSTRGRKSLLGTEAKERCGNQTLFVQVHRIRRRNCRGRRRSPREHLWGRSPFVCPAGAESAQRADRGEHTGGLPRFGPRRTRKTLLLLWFVLLWGARELQELAAPSV